MVAQQKGLGKYIQPYHTNKCGSSVKTSVLAHSTCFYMVACLLVRILWSFPAFPTLALANESDLPMSYYVSDMYAVKETREKMHQTRKKKTMHT